MILYLGRHGETIWNKLDLAQGAHDIPLSDKGISLARQTAQGLAASGITFDRVYTSPLKRAYDTASYIYEETVPKNKQGTPLCPLIADDRLREFSFGESEGTSIVGIASRPEHPLYGFFCDPSSSAWPIGGETFQEVRDRFRSFIIEEILPLEGSCDRVLVVAHGGILREGMDWITHRERQGYLATASQFSNCSFQILECRDGILSLIESGRTFY